MERKIHFFKIMVGDFGHRLRIPPAFVKYVKQGITGAILECSNGRLWHVKLQKRPSGLYLENGWEGFAKEHCLQMHDCLVFGYDGAVNFTVQIYGTSACQKNDVCFKKTPPHCNSCDERKKQTISKKRSLDSNKSSHHYVAPRDEMKSHKKCGVDLPSKLPTDACVGSVPGPSVTQGDGHAKNKTKDVKRSVTAKVDLRRQHPLDEAKGRPGDKYYHFTSKFPSFLVQITRSSVRTGASVTIPSAFWKKNLPEVSKLILVQDPDGMLWEMSYHLTKDDRNKISQARLCGGWWAFAKHHNLAAGDVCAFELVDQNKMKAHIFCSDE